MSVPIHRPARYRRGNRSLRFGGGFPCLSFSGAADQVAVTDNASLQDLPTADLTIEAWLKPVDTGLTVYILYKGSWYNALLSNDRYRGYFNHESSVAIANSTIDVPYNLWTHFAVDWNSAALRFNIFFNGTANQTSAAAVGSYVSDVGDNFLIPYVGNPYHGLLGWVRLSSVRRYTANFTPPARYPPPAVDGDTVELWTVDQGAGSTLTASVNSPANDGAITGAAWTLG